MRQKHVQDLPQSCSFDGTMLAIKDQRLPFVYYKQTYELWMPAKPVMRITGEQNMTHFLDRVHEDDQTTLEELAAARGVPPIRPITTRRSPSGSTRAASTL